MPSPSREVARDALAALIEADMGAGGDNLVTDVLNYSTTDIQGKTPVVMVFSDGTNRPNREGFGDDSYFATEARLRVTMFVALPGPEDTVYTHAAAEDLLDTLDRRLADLVIANNSTASWMSLRYETGFSRPRDVALPGGSRYTIESHTLIAKLR